MPFTFADVLILRYLIGDVDENQTVKDFNLINDSSELNWAFRSQVKKFVKRFIKDTYRNEDTEWIRNLSEVVKKRNCTNVQCHTYNIQTGYVECTHEYWRSNGKFAPNITLRLASGGYIGGGLYHSQNLEGALTTLPGARIVCPSFADDAAGLLRTSMRSKGFTLFLEPKALYNSVEAAAVVPEDFEVPFGKARIRREGSDLSIITYGNTTHFCLHAAERLEKEGGWKVEVIDIRSLIPLDKEAIFESVKKTSKALVVHEDKVFSGFGAELAAMISGEMFRYLDGPVQRVGSTFTPVGFNPILEKEILPDEAKIYEAARRLLEY